MNSVAMIAPFVINIKNGSLQTVLVNAMLQENKNALRDNIGIHFTAIADVRKRKRMLIVESIESILKMSAGVYANRNEKEDVVERECTNILIRVNV